MLLLYALLVVFLTCSCMQVASPAEERQRGSVKRGLYLTYLRAWGPALVVPIAFVIFSFGSEVLSVCLSVAIHQKLCSLQPLHSLQGAQISCLV